MLAEHWEAGVHAPFKGESSLIQPEPLARLVGLELG